MTHSVESISAEEKIRSVLARFSVQTWPRLNGINSLTSALLKIVSPQWRTGAALNNQCPVCGTMAQPIEKVDEIPELNFNLRRCDLCNCCFWQVGE